MRPAGPTRALRHGEAGQAQVELVAAVPVAVCLLVAILQLFAVGYSQSLADGSAEAGAYALAAGTEAEGAALDALPSWAQDQAEVEVDGGRVWVALRSPSLLDVVGERLEVDASAWARPAPDGS